jgi:hypothetical protein
MVTLVNRAKVSTSTTGTGTITLGSAESGYQTFADAGVADGDVVRYVIEDGTAWEIGTGTYTASGTTLSRTVDESSNSDAALNLSGSAVVYVSAAAEDIPPVLELYAENPSSPTAPSATGTNAVAIGTSASAAGSGGVAAGNGATASGANAVAFGRANTASGQNSFAFGFSNTASAAYSVAIHGNATADETTAIGRNSSGQPAQAVTGQGAMALGGSYASGTDSFAAAIANNTSSYGATGANSVAIGQLAKATGTRSVAIGYLPQATGIYSVALGNQNQSTSSQSFSAGYGNISSGNTTIALGQSNTASGSRSFVLGSSNSATQTYSGSIGRFANSDIIGKIAVSSGVLGALGIAQNGIFVLASDTTDATPEALTTNNSAASTDNQIILPNNSAYAFHGTIVARQQASAGTACAAWKIEGLIRREGSAGTTVLVNSATTVLDNTPGWGMALSADTTNGGLKIEVTGAAATNIRWVATISTSECTY